MDAGYLEIACRVNGEVRQRANTRDMLFTPAAVLAYVSCYITLQPGDILFTGTPEQLIQAAEGHVGVFWEREAGQEQGLHITARVNTSQGVRCRAVADALPAYVQRSEPSLEDAYLYLISREAVQ